MSTLLFIIGWLLVGFLSGLSIKTIDIMLHKLKNKEYSFSLTEFIFDMILTMILSPVALLALIICLLITIADIFEHITNSSISNPIRIRIKCIDACISELINGKRGVTK